MDPAERATVKAPGRSRDIKASHAPAWREESRRLIEQTIDEAIDEQPELEQNPRALFELVAKAYPHGPRKGRYFRIWLDELRRARAKVEPECYSEAPIDRPCTTCGAKPGRSCTPVGDDDPIAADLIVIGDAAPHGRGRRSVALSLAADVVHAARRGANGATA